MKKHKWLSSLLLVFNLLLAFYGFSQSVSFKTYMNPVIPGDHPDCTITKVGKDYYTTGSSFNPTPVIYHSTDLVHWEAIAQPVSAAWNNYGDSPGAGCWGGNLVYYKNKFWDFFGVGYVMYFTTASKPEGPWSQPVLVKVPASVPGLGADNSIFVDSDSTWYLLVKNGQLNNWIVQLGNDGHPAGAIYDLTWINPSPAFPYGWAEGPVMWKYKGYYYYSFAQNVGGGQKVMRSTTLTADKAAWSVPIDLFNESDPQKASALFTSPNHSSAAMLIDDSTSWVIHPTYAKGEWGGQGRQGLFNQVKYNANLMPVADYPINQPKTAPNLPSSGIPWMVPKSDFFTSTKLNPEWSFLGYTASSTYSLTERPGWLRLSPKSSTKPNIIIKNDGEHNYSLITRLQLGAKLTTDEAGIKITDGAGKKFITLCSSLNSTNQKVIKFGFGTFQYEAENTVGDTVWLKMYRVNHIISGYFSNNGTDWSQVGQNISVASIDSYADFSSWTGSRQGLYVQGKPAYFDLYIYRDAYTPILAECSANQFGTTRTQISTGVYVLDNIHNTDWAMYAGVEFGNSEYAKNADSIQITASCVSEGGNVEVWLDSIDSGTKISSCAILNTGNLSTFKVFAAPVSNVSGRHDVYLRFTGSSSSALFRLKFLGFHAAKTLTDIENGDMKSGEISIYPNPAFNVLTFNIKELPSVIKLFSLDGKLLLSQNTNQFSTELNIEKFNQGIFLVEVSNSKGTITKKIVKN